METDSFDEYSIIDAASSDDQLEDKSTGNGALAVKLARKSLYKKVNFYFIKLIGGRLTAKFYITCNEIVPLATDAIRISNVRVSHMKGMDSILSPSHELKRDFTMSFDAFHIISPGEYKLEYVSTDGYIVDSAGFMCYSKTKDTDLRPDDSSDDDFGDITSSTSSWSSLQSNRSEEAVPATTTRRAFKVQKTEDLSPFVTECKENHRFNKLENLKENIPDEGPAITDLKGDQSPIVTELREDLRRSRSANSELKELQRGSRDSLMTLYINQNKKCEELVKLNEFLLQTSTKMKSQIHQLEKEVVREKRGNDAANKYARDLRCMYQDSKVHSLEETKRLKKEIKKLRKREAMLLQELPRRAPDSSDSEASLQTSVSGTMSSSSLNEFSAVLEQKMEKISKSFTEQFSHMQENIVKLLPEDKVQELNAAGAPAEMSTSAADVGEIFQPAVVNEMVMKYYDEMRQPQCMRGGSNTEENYSIASDVLTEASDFLGSLYFAVQDSKVVELAETSDQIMNLSSAVENSEVVELTETSDQMVNLSSVVEDPEVVELTETSDDLGRLSLDVGDSQVVEPQSINDESSEAEAQPSYSCSMCDYKCEGDYTSIVDHFNTRHMEKKCPICTYTQPWDQDEQLNCHVQAHLDEEDARSKAAARGWIFSSLNFD